MYAFQYKKKKWRRKKYCSKSGQKQQLIVAVVVAVSLQNEQNYVKIYLYIKKNTTTYHRRYASLIKSFKYLCTLPLLYRSFFQFNSLWCSYIFAYIATNNKSSVSMLWIACATYTSFFHSSKTFLPFYLIKKSSFSTFSSFFLLILFFFKCMLNFILYHIIE